MIIQGWDISLNHAGICQLEEGQKPKLFFVTIKPTIAKKFENGIHLKLSKTKDKIAKSIERLNEWDYIIAKFMDETRPTHVAVEGYAFGKSMGAHQMGGIGEKFKQIVYNKGISLRVYQPTSIKMATAFHGHAKKDRMIKYVKDRFKVDLSKYPKDIQEDLADSYGIANLAKIEREVKDSNLVLENLHPKEVHVLTTKTKANPVPLIIREWSQRDFNGRI